MHYALDAVGAIALSVADRYGQGTCFPEREDYAVRLPPTPLPNDDPDQSGEFRWGPA